MRSFKKSKTLKGALLAILATAFFALSGCSSSPYKIDSQATAAAPWKVGEVITKSVDKNDDSNSSWKAACVIYGKGRVCDYERVFLGVSKEGHYLVQDFYTVETVQRYLKDSPGKRVNPGKRVKGTDPYLMSGKAAVQFSLLSPAKIADIHGRITVWYLTGHKEFEGEVKNGLHQGRWTTWHENGQMIASEYFIGGEEDGLSEFWHLDGKIISRNLYVMGKRHGEQEQWYENVPLYIITNYIDGERDGADQWWWYGDEEDKSRQVSYAEAKQLVKKYDEEKENKSKKNKMLRHGVR